MHVNLTCTFCKGVIVKNWMGMDRKCESESYLGMLVSLQLVSTFRCRKTRTFSCTGSRSQKPVYRNAAGTSAYLKRRCMLSAVLHCCALLCTAVHSLLLSFRSPRPAPSPDLQQHWASAEARCSSCSQRCRGEVVRGRGTRHDKGPDRLSL